MAQRSATTPVMAGLAKALLLATALGANAAPPIASIQTVDLSKLARKDVQASLEVTVYRADGVTEKQPLIVFVPNRNAQIEPRWFQQQAEFFTQMGYVVAVPHLGHSVDVLTVGNRPPMGWDLVEFVEPYAIELLATVAALTSARGVASANHVVLGQGMGSLIAARYAALKVPGCIGLIMVSAGYGLHVRSATAEDMRDSEAAFTQLGPAVKIPSLWLYAKGNQRVREQSANDLFAGFQAGSPSATLVILPELGVDGDNLFSNPAVPRVWQPEVSKFLASLDWK